MNQPTPTQDPVREALDERVAFLLNATRDAQNHAADYGQRAVGHRTALLLVADAESLEEAKEAAHEELQRPYPPVTLSTFITAAQMWHKEAFPQAYTLTAEQKAVNLRRLQGFEPLDAPPSPPDDTALLRQCLEAMELRLCESERLVLRANQNYVFTIDPTCESCLRIGRAYTEPLGDLPVGAAPPPSDAGQRAMPDARVYLPSVDLAIDALDRDPPTGSEWPVNWPIVVHGLKQLRAAISESEGSSNADR